MQSKTTLKRVRGYNMVLNLGEVVELINGVGFPIAVCVALFWFNRETAREQQKLLAELKDTIRSISESVQDLIDGMKRK